MTSTPESWDDVGCLRLQVNSISNELARMHVREQDISHELVRMHLREEERKEERRYMKICHFVGIVTAVVLIGVVALQSIVIRSMHSGAASILSQRLADAAFQAHLHNIKDSEANFLMPATQVDNRKNSSVQHLRLMPTLMPIQEAGENIDANTAAARVQQVQQLLEKAMALNKNLIAATGAQAVEGSPQQNLQDIRKDVKVAKTSDSNGGDHLENRKQPTEETSDDKRLTLPIDVYGAFPQQTQPPATTKDEAKPDADTNVPKAEARQTMVSKDKEQKSKAPEEETELADATQVARTTKQRNIPQDQDDRKKNEDEERLQVSGFQFQPQLPNVTPEQWLQLLSENVPVESQTCWTVVPKAQKLQVEVDDLMLMLNQIMARRGIPVFAGDFDIVCDEAIVLLPKVAARLKEQRKGLREM